MKKTIIVSDIHLWLPDSQAQKFLAFLHRTPTERLIINWDLIDELYIRFFSKWKPKHTSVIEQMLAICKKNNTEILYIQGNHDADISSLTGFEHINILQDMIYTSQGKKYYICHGHQFDTIKNIHKRISYLWFFGWNFIYLINRIYGNIRKKLWLKKRSLVKTISPLARFIMWWGNSLYKKLQAEAIKHGCDGIICGHYHKAEDRRLGKIHYLNSWEWIESCSALIEDQQWNWNIVYEN